MRANDSRPPPSHELTHYWNAALTAALAPGVLSLRALLHQRSALAFTSGLLTELCGSAALAPTEVEDAAVLTVTA